MSSDPFYVGYLDPAPASLMRTVRARVRLVLLAVLVVAASLAATQRPFSRAQFEFGTTRTLEGWIEAEPHPTLVVWRGGDQASWSRYLLTAFGKFGAPEEVAALAGKKVRVEGTLIHRDDQVMLELADGGVEVLEPRPGETAPSSDPERLGTVTLEGEIVDSKCFLGVMKPGNAKTHRACAVRCISGGIPPVLLVRSEDETARYVLLVGEDGGNPGPHLLDRVAEPVRVTGALERRGDQLSLRAAVEEFERVD